MIVSVPVLFTANVAVALTGRPELGFTAPLAVLKVTVSADAATEATATTANAEIARTRRCKFNILDIFKFPSPCEEPTRSSLCGTSNIDLCWEAQGCESDAGAMQALTNPAKPL